MRSGVAANLDDRRLEARLGYGFGAVGGRWMVVPELGMDLLDEGWTYRAGGRLVEWEDSDTAFDVGLEVTQREQAGAAGAEQGVALRFGWGERVAADLVFDAGLEVTRREQAGVAGAEHGAALGFGWSLDGAQGRGLELRLDLSRARGGRRRPAPGGGGRAQIDRAVVIPGRPSDRNCWVKPPRPFRPVANLGRSGLSPAGSRRGFPSCPSVYMAFPLTKLCLAQ